MENTKYGWDNQDEQKRREMNRGITALKFEDTAVNQMLSTAYFKVEHALHWLDDSVFDFSSEDYVLDHQTLLMLGIAVRQLKSLLHPVLETIEAYVYHNINLPSSDEENENGCI